MKKFLLCAFCVLLAMTLVFAATAEHTHTYANGNTEREVDYDNPSYQQSDDYDHLVVYDVYVYPVCDECGQRGSTAQMDTESEYESHTWKDGKCTKCGLTCAHEYDESGACWRCGAPCPHSEGTQVYIEEMSKEGTAKEIPGDDEHHTATAQIKRVTRCNTCYKVLKEELMEEVTGEEIWHNYDNGVCVDCGHKCSHSASTWESHWEDWDENRKVENINDLKYHEITGIWHSEVCCDTCGMTLSRTDGTTPETRQEAHQWNWDDENNCEGDTCEVCGYVRTCEHKNLTEETEEMWDNAEDTGNNSVHKVNYILHTMVICKDCGKMISSSDEESVQQEPHDYTPGGICRMCGHENTCQHKNTDTYTELDYDNAKYTVVDSRLHRAVGTKYTITECNSCGMILSKKAAGTGIDTWTHWYEEGSNVCQACGYKNTCAHKNTETSVELWGGNYENECKDVGSDAYHEVTGRSTVVTTCKDCGAQISTKPGEIATWNNEHDYVDGVCTFCGHVNACKHEHTINGEGILRGWNISDIGDSKQHQITGGLYKYTWCNDCNTYIAKQLIDADGKMMEDHRFENGACIFCGYKAETPAAASQEAEETTPVELVYEPVDDTAVISGVKASDALPMAEALAIVGETLDGEDVTIEIPGIEKVLDKEEMEQFNKLSIQERLMIALDALGFSDILKAALADNPDLLSPEAQALMEEIDARIGAMTPEELEALTKLLTELFVQEKVVIDGQEYTCFCIDLVITRDGEKTYQRYAFRQDDEGQWILCQIAVGEYQPVKA